VCRRDNRAGEPALVFFIAPRLYGLRPGAWTGVFREFLAFVAENRTFPLPLFQADQLLNNGDPIAIFCRCAYGH